MTSNVAQPEIADLIEAKDFTTLKSTLREMEIHDLADLLRGLEGDSLAVAFRLLTSDRAADILGEFEPEQQELLIESLSSRRVATILAEMPPDDRTELLEELPGELAQRLLANLRGDELRTARSLLAYPEDSIGRLMTPEYVAVRPDWSLGRVLEHIRTVGEETETLNVIYVVDDRWQLLDEVPLERLVLAHPDTVVRDLMDEQVAFLDAHDDQETAIELFKKYDAVALPVVNRRGVLVGIVTHDDVMDVTEEETTEDFQMLAGMAALEHTYLGTGYFGMLRKRLPWLVLLLGAQLLTTVALSQFYAVPLFAVLVIFMPLINSPAGNTGSQMAGLILRALAVAEVNVSDWWRVLLRELTRGLTLGAILAALGFVAAMLFASVLDTDPYPPELIAVSVAAAMAIMVTLANALGSMLPFFFKWAGLDPAVTSAPFIASLMDVTGILIYFGVGMSVLAWLGA